MQKFMDCVTSSIDYLLFKSKVFILIIQYQ